LFSGTIFGQTSSIGYSVKATHRFSEDHAAAWLTNAAGAETNSRHDNSYSHTSIVTAHPRAG
jgi:hypothetical protein